MTRDIALRSSPELGERVPSVLGEHRVLFGRGLSLDQRSGADEPRCAVGIVTALATNPGTGLAWVVGDQIVDHHVTWQFVGITADWTTLESLP